MESLLIIGQDPAVCLQECRSRILGSSGEWKTEFDWLGRDIDGLLNLSPIPPPGSHDQIQSRPVKFPQSMVPQVENFFLSHHAEGVVRWPIAHENLINHRW